METVSDHEGLPAQRNLQGDFSTLVPPRRQSDNVTIDASILQTFGITGLGIITDALAKAQTAHGDLPPHLGLRVFGESWIKTCYNGDRDQVIQIVLEVSKDGQVITKDEITRQDATESQVARIVRIAAARIERLYNGARYLK